MYVFTLLFWLSGSHVCFLSSIVDQRMIQYQTMLQFAISTQHVSSTTINLHTTHDSMQKMWIYTILKPYFHHKNVRWFQIHLDRWVHMIVSSHQVKSEFASQITKLFHFQNLLFLLFSMTVACCYNGCNLNNQ